MRLGASFRQTMSGTYWLLDAPTDERAISVTIEAFVDDLRGFLRDMKWRVRGTIDAERLASGCELEGAVAFRFVDEQRVSFLFAFIGDDGRRYELSGEKEWSGLAPFESIALLPATLYDERGDELARATLRFDLRSGWARLMKSARLRLSR
jgi:hypothetical protein